MASTPDAAAAATCGHASAGDGELLGTGNVAEDGVRRGDADRLVLPYCCSFFNGNLLIATF